MPISAAAQPWQPKADQKNKKSAPRFTAKGTENSKSFCYETKYMSYAHVRVYISSVTSAIASQEEEELSTASLPSYCDGVQYGDSLLLT